jgi:hypothetical protein
MYTHCPLLLLASFKSGGVERLTRDLPCSEPGIPIHKTGIVDFLTSQSRPSYGHRCAVSRFVILHPFHATQSAGSTNHQARPAFSVIFLLLRLNRAFTWPLHLAVRNLLSTPSQRSGITVRTQQ